MPRVLAISNQKGGVGKTTTAINLATSLALEDLMVLLIDLDPQGNASSGLGVCKDDVKLGVSDVLLGFRELPEVVVPTCVDGLHLVPATREQVGLEIELVEVARREYRLQRALVHHAQPYDMVIIDCPPSLNLLTINALAAADGVLIPMQAEYYAMEGLSELLRAVNQIQKGGLNRNLARAGIVLTMVDRRTRLCRDVCDQVREVFGTEVFDTEIPRNVRLGEAPSFGRPVHAYDPLCRGAIAYSSLAIELLERIAATTGDLGTAGGPAEDAPRPTPVRNMEAS
jgi:chromosome partitioning protein